LSFVESISIGEDGWAPGPVWLGVENRKYLSFGEVRTPNHPASSRSAFQSLAITVPFFQPLSTNFGGVPLDRPLQTIFPSSALSSRDNLM
jgi:hypothetical protein